MNIYNYSVRNGAGENVSLEEYKGKVLLIMNSATECGFTPQYDEIQDLYEKYGDQGFEVLDFPCNQFGNQAPGTHEEIQSLCSLRFNITFPIFDKVNVNGENQEPLFAFLKSKKGFTGFNEEHPITPKLVSLFEQINPNYKENDDIKWNFTKFLIDREGNVVNRFEPTEDSTVVEKSIKNHLKNAA
jgi:glutathione peroxidase